MARTFNGTSAKLSNAVGYLSAMSGGDFCVTVWFKPLNLTQSNCCVLRSGNANNDNVFWALVWEVTNNMLHFVANGYTGAWPAAGITFDSDDVADGAFVAWRRDVYGWTTWKNGAKTLHDTAPTFVLGGFGSPVTTTVGADRTGGTLAAVAGDVAEVAIWRGFAPSDTEMAALGRGLAPDQVGKSLLSAYWPLRGTEASVEPSYRTTLGLDSTNDLTVVNATKAVHPRVTGPLVVTDPVSAWVLELRTGYASTGDDDAGTFWCASMDLPEPIDVDTIGVFAKRRILNADQVAVSHALPDVQHGVQQDGQVTVILDNTAQLFNPSVEYRNKAAVLRRYERTTHEYVTELAGVVLKATVVPTTATFIIGTRVASVLNLQVPRQVVNVDEFPSATDLLAPVPVMCGRGVVSPPACGYNDQPNAADINDPGGADFLVSALHDRNGDDMPVLVEKVWWDASSDGPGLELATDWADAPGNPTYQSATTFTVTGDQSAFYASGITAQGAGANGAGLSGGWTLRFKKAAPDETYYYTYISPVTPYAAGVVTVGSGGEPLVPGMRDVQMTSGYFAEYGRYTVGGAGSPLLSIRFAGQGNQEAGLLVQAYNSALTNPATVIAEILSNTQWGAGESLVTSDFTRAATLFTLAGLGDAVNGVIGGQRQQVRVEDLLNALCLLRGAWVWWDGEYALWRMTVDVPPAAPTVTLGFGDGVWNNILTVPTHEQYALDAAPLTLRLRYGPGGRAKSNKDFGQEFFPASDYLYQVNASPAGGTIVPFGQEVVLGSTWLAKNTHARVVCAYLGKRLKCGDDVYTVVAGMEARLLRLNELVQLEIPFDGVSAPYRVRGYTRQLHQTSLQVEVYDPTTYTYADNDVYYDGSGVNTEADLVDQYNKTTVPGFGVNQLVNPDFSVAVQKATLHTYMIPGWLLTTAWPVSLSEALTSVRIITAGTATPNPLNSIGGSILEIISTGAGVVSLGALSSLQATIADGFATTESDLWLLSVYAPAMGALTPQWAFGILWIVEDHTAPFADYKYVWAQPRMQTAGVDRNRLGWHRYYCHLKAPALTYRVIPYIQLPNDAVGGTYYFDAVQLELASARSTALPTQWKRHPRWGIDPAAMQPGDHTVRADASSVSGTKTGHVQATQDSIAGQTSVRFTGDNGVPGGVDVIGVTAKWDGITGPTQLSIGFDTGDTNDPAQSDLGAWAAAVDVDRPQVIDGGVAGNGYSDMTDFRAISPIRFPKPAAVVVTAEGGVPFGGGSITILIHYTQLIGPTA